MAGRHPSHIYRGATEPRVDLPPPEIPKSPMPWFIVLLAVFAVVTVAGIFIGFWRAAHPPAPVQEIESRPSEARPEAPVP